MLSDEDTRVSSIPGHAAGDDPGGAAARRRGGLHRAGDPEGRSSDDRHVRGAGTAPEALRALPRRHPAAPRAHKTDAEEKLLATPGDHERSLDHLRGVCPTPTSRTRRSRSATARPREARQRRVQHHRTVPNREDRQKVMSAFFGALGKFRGTFGATLNSQIQSDIFVARSRDYATRSKRRSTGRTFRPRSTRGWSTASTSTCRRFHRYLKLRQKMMGVSGAALLRPLRAAGRVRGCDVHAGRGGKARRWRPWRRSGRTTPACVTRAFNERWIDLLPNDGKRSGAYSNGGAYDVHPFMLLNYNGKYNDVSTLAHELGHTMQSYYSNKTQPFATASLPDLRRRSRVDVQRGAAHRPHAEEHQGRRDPAVAARQLSRRHQVHGLPADAVRRVRAAGARDGGEGRANHRRSARQALRRHHEEVLRPRPGRARVDDYVAHEWAFIPHFYRPTTCSSTPRRSPRRRRCRRR